MRVKDLMKAPVVTIDEEAPVYEAMSLMAGHRIRRLPVVREGKLVGIVTDRDCKRAWASPAPALSRYELTYLLEPLRVKEVMTCEVVTVTPETSALEAARLMEERRIGGLPVVEGGEIVGILTTTDLLVALREFLGERCPPAVGQILVPTDFSEGSGRAVEYATDLAGNYEASLILLNVQPPPHLSQVEGPVPAELLDRIRQSQEQEALARLRDAFPDGERTRYLVVTGYPERAIPWVARTAHADLIVMATHGRTGLTRVLAGSVTEAVLQHAPCPVLALRTIEKITR